MKNPPSAKTEGTFLRGLAFSHAVRNECFHAGKADHANGRNLAFLRTVLEETENPVVEIRGLFVGGVTETRIDKQFAVPDPPVHLIGRIYSDNPVLLSSDDRACGIFSDKPRNSSAPPWRSSAPCDLRLRRKKSMRRRIHGSYR